MNVMLLSVAVWSGAEGATRDLFHLISAAIALPVVGYSGQPFFQSALQALRARRLNMDVPISLAILLATGMSTYESLAGGHHAYFDAALSLTFFLLIGRYLDHRSRSNARSAAKELAALEVQSCTRLRDGQAETLRSAEVTVGDHLLVPAGARVPVDGVLETPEALLDRSFLTGESEAVTVAQDSPLQAGEINLGAPFQMRATAVGCDTTLRRIADMVATAESGRNSYTALADRAARIYAPLVHILALLALLAWWGATSDFRHALNIAIAVLIITCPCALGLAVPAVSTAAISRLFKAGYLVKHATALERLAEVDHVVFDKTGTLSVPSVALPAAMTPAEQAVSRALAQQTAHPMAQALLRALDDVPPATLKAVKEVPGQGIEARWHGQSVKLGQGAFLGASFAGFGLRIGDAPAIALPHHERLRPGVKEALQGLDLPLEVLTGDKREAAEAFARKIGLPVTAGVSPIEKCERLEALASEGHRVLMVGDGLNDTVALASAHASIAPASALDAARSASDLVLLKEHLSDLPLVRAIACATVRLSKQNFALAALYNLIAVPVALAGFATPLAAALAMSVSSITVLLNAQRIRSVS